MWPTFEVYYDNHGITVYRDCCGYPQTITEQGIDISKARNAALDDINAELEKVGASNLVKALQEISLMRSENEILISLASKVIGGAMTLDQAANNSFRPKKQILAAIERIKIMNKDIDGEHEYAD